MCVDAFLYHWYQGLTIYVSQTAHDHAVCCSNTLRPRQNGHRVADNTFERMFVNKNVRILIKISLKFVPKGPINNIPALIQIMAWHRLGDKPLSEPMIVRLPTHICVTRPQWVNRALNKTYLILFGNGASEISMVTSIGMSMHVLRTTDARGRFGNLIVKYCHVNTAKQFKKYVENTVTKLKAANQIWKIWI